MLVLFSEHEKMVLQILGRKKMTVQEISDTFYHSLEVPLAERNYVANIVRRISAKCEKMKLKWTLVGKGGGRGGRTVWRDKRVQNRTKRSS